MCYFYNAKMLTTWICIILMLTVCGCGTIMNIARTHPEYYGGIEKDFKALGNIGSDIGKMPVKTAGDVFLLPFAIAGYGLFTAIFITDSGLSLVGDTLTIPVVYQKNNHSE